MIFLILIGCVLISLGILIYRSGTANENHFKDRNIPYIKPKFIVGNLFDIFFQRSKNLVDFGIAMTNYQNNAPRAVGVFEMRKPVVLLNDPILVNQLAIKDFDHFTDHRPIADDIIDKIFAQGLFSMRGQTWRDMRITLSPAFTGNKMRKMFGYIVDVTMQMTESLQKRGPQVFGYEMRDLSSRFMNDVIAICAFGVSVNSFEHPNNEFFTSGMKLIDFSSLKSNIKFFCFRLFPKLATLLKIHVFDKTMSKFFKELILDTLEYREKNGLRKNDVVDMLLRVRQGHDIEEAAVDNRRDSAGFATVQESVGGNVKAKRMWTDDEIVAQTFVFFVGGFDTTSTLLTFATYELMFSPDVQQRLFEEVSAMHAANGGNALTYDDLVELKYLDMVISETLRKWPPQPVIDRICTKPFELSNGDFNYKFEKGNVIWLNAIGIQNNPKYYPDPHKFDPERFSEKNSKSISNGRYFPFGMGPRACIASRFALMTAKIMLYYLVLNFELVITEKTPIPLKIKRTFLPLENLQGVWLGLKPRGESKISPTKQ